MKKKLRVALLFGGKSAEHEISLISARNIVAAMDKNKYDIVAIGIILDAVAQFLIFGQVHPGAAVVIGPILITAPYAFARALTNRVTRTIK